MALRISGITIPNHKRVEVALTYVYGIGLVKSQKVLSDLKIDPSTRVKDLTEDQENKLRSEIEKKHDIEGDLRRVLANNIKRLKEIGSYRGTRHAKKLPVRGQRSKTNSRTVRGGKKATVGSGKKPAPGKT